MCPLNFEVRVRQCVNERFPMRRFDRRGPVKMCLQNFLSVVVQNALLRRLHNVQFEIRLSRKVIQHPLFFFWTKYCGLNLYIRFLTYLLKMKSIGVRFGNIISRYRQILNGENKDAYLFVGKHYLKSFYHMKIYGTNV